MYFDCFESVPEHQRGHLKPFLIGVALAFGSMAAAFVVLTSVM